MTRKELMKARLTEVGTKKGMIDKDAASAEYTLGFSDGWEEADEHPQSLWISVKDELPEAQTLVLALQVNENDTVSVVPAACNNGTWNYGLIIGAKSSQVKIDVGLNNVTHWMPLPPFPEEGGKE